MRLYVSGQMSNMPEHNFPAFNEAAAELRRAGFDVVNPADRGIVPGWTWNDYLKVDLPDMWACDGVALLPGWAGSKGARLEVFVAEEMGLPVQAVAAWVAQAVATAGAA